MVLPGGDANLFIDSIAGQTGKQWRRFAAAQRGQMKLAGRSGHDITYSGTNPAGMEAYLEMMAISDRGSTYLLMISAPKAEFNFFQSGFDRLEKSLRLTSRIPSGAYSASIWIDATGAAAQSSCRAN
jgi:hypothetical protein